MRRFDGEVIVNWVPVVQELVDASTQAFAYFNNHFAGHAPSSAEMFREMWNRLMRQETHASSPA